jgi:hypothetical protein
MRLWVLIVLLLAMFAAGCDESASACGHNDGPGPGNPPTTPAPAAIALVGIGTWIVGKMRMK